MVTKKFFGVLLTMMLIITVLSACGNKEKYLSGTYHLQIYANQMSYDFDEEGNVTMQISVAGFVVLSQDGTYSIDSEQETITLSFPLIQQEDITKISNGITSLSGTFAFQEEDDYILIGTVRYEKTS